MTDSRAKAAKPREKNYRLSAGRGMYLEVTAAGSKYWRLKYRFAGKEKRLALGVYPEITYRKAGLKRDEARKLLADGVDPSEVKRAQKLSQKNAASNSFEVVAREWQSKRTKWSENYRVKVLQTIERNLLPYLGKRSISSISAPDLLAVLRKIETRGAVETAHRVKQIAGQIFRYGVATGRAERDPSADLKGALASPVEKHLASVTDPKRIGPLLLAFDEYIGTPTVKSALRLAPILFVRPGELRHAEWQEINFDTAEWQITAKKMKMNQSHIVPLCRQAVEILKEQQLLTGQGQYVFPSARSSKRPMSDNAILAALRRMGIEKNEMSGHGFRAMARTILDEKLKIRVDWIEHQLAHAVKDPNGRAYNRTTFLPERKEMMQKWADFLDNLKTEASSSNVIAAAFGNHN
ncbi:MAG: integrase [Gammaproteobacteria bacterium]|nr:integrase [Gammaproteobacteria bacterium]